MDPKICWHAMCTCAASRAWTQFRIKAATISLLSPMSSHGRGRGRNQPGKRKKGRLAVAEEDSGPVRPVALEAQYASGSSVPIGYAPVKGSQAKRRSPSPKEDQRSRQDAAAAHHEPAEPTPKAKTSRYKSTSVAMKEFTARSQDVLNAILSHEYDPHVLEHCECGLPDALRSFRCVDCFQQPPQCEDCVAQAHVHNPFHRIQKWNGQYFRRWSLSRMSANGRTVTLRLGHSGASCPSIRDDIPGRAFTIVDTNGVHSIRVIYCRCPHAALDPFQLLGASLYPATWDSPRTAFTFRLMKHYHLDSLQSRKPAYDYWAVIRRLTDNTRSKGIAPRYEELLRVSREWRCLMRLKRSGQALGIAKFLPNESTSVGVVCPACPRPGFNMPDDWREKQTPDNMHVNAEFLGIDGNCRAVVKNKRHDVHDVPLLDGRAYFVNSEEYAAREELAKVDPEESKSTCVTLRSMNTFTRRKGVIISGIIAVVCVRHSLYRLNAVVDMEVGEKFWLMDLALAGALGENPDPDILRFLMCDKGCQYGVNLLARFKETYPHLAPIVEEMIMLINKLHLQGHREDCRYRFSPQYTCSCGRTDGEGVERPWPHSNETAKITQDMNPGHRKDTFDDTNTDWNYRKVISMMTSLLDKLRAAYENRDAAEVNFDAINGGVGEELVKEWEQLPTTAWLEEGVWRSVYRADQAKMPKYAELVARLAEEDEKEAKALGSVDFDRSLSATAFLDSALTLEQKQCVQTICVDYSSLAEICRNSLLEFISSLPKAPATPSDDQKRDLCLRRANLRDDITSFRELQAIHMPCLGAMPDSGAYELHMDEDFGQPEKEDLTLPSDWPHAAERARLNLAALGDKEYALRRGAADRALARMKLAIQTANRFLTFKHRNVRGYGPNTRAEGVVQKHNKTRDKHANAYRRHYAAMEALGLRDSDTEKYHPLLPSDLSNLHVDANQSEKLGANQVPQPWFWAGDRDADEKQFMTQKSLDDLSQEELRVRWFRSRVHRDRCREEVDILHAELERTASSFTRMGAIWRKVAGEQVIDAAAAPEGDATSVTKLPAAVLDGRRAYAFKQASIYAQWEGEAKVCLEKAGKYLEGERRAKKRGADGEPKTDDEPGEDFQWCYMSK
ncbi:hypothetical protein EXIGLDRAFT_670364 [Exidia glandulosa HHB12029]|uniref:CxC2-like cysteine cluster KDZ transposase-associated domain-containing protein n=1 Tax=Exidia glandulosa HHB12029 TaxID=1314781 RepID=A0A165L0C4_EXIGL|nr:hypothetical protein EXIGLDRAFT_670364 [Exidia glandulosa HHB12029]